MLTNSQEEYLKNIYLLGQENEQIRVTDISKKTLKTKASVSVGLQNLKELDLIEYEPYGKIRLTEKGQSESKKIIEAEDIITLFMTEVLKIDKKQAESEAINIKTYLKDDTINRLAKHTYKLLGIDLKNYNINNEKCIQCKIKSNILK